MATLYGKAAGMAKYLIRTQDDDDDDVVAAFHHRECEMANYRLNIANFRDMLSNDSDDDFRTQLVRLIEENEKQLSRSLLTYEALLRRLPEGDHRDAAIRRYHDKKGV